MLSDILYVDYLHVYYVGPCARVLASTIIPSSHAAIAIATEHIYHIKENFVRTFLSQHKYISLVVMISS